MRGIVGSPGLAFIRVASCRPPDNCGRDAPIAQHDSRRLPAGATIMLPFTHASTTALSEDPCLEDVSGIRPRKGSLPVPSVRWPLLLRSFGDCPPAHCQVGGSQSKARIIV